MHRTLLTLVLLASASFLPVASHADTVDQFTHTRDSHSITYSLPPSIDFTFESPQLRSAAFIPGSYTGDSLNSFGSQPFSASVLYDLTIKQESTAPAVPEPSSLLLLVSGAAGLLYRVVRPRPPQTFL